MIGGSLPAKTGVFWLNWRVSDLIVIGTHTSSGMGHGFIGSAARRLIHITDRPTLVVPVVKK